MESGDERAHIVRGMVQRQTLIGSVLGPLHQEGNARRVNHLILRQIKLVLGKDLLALRPQRLNLHVP